MNALFDACCGLMQFVGQTFGFSYKEICVIGNLYVQGGLLWLLGIAAAIKGGRLLRRADTRFDKRLSVCGILDGVVSTALFAWLVVHYRGGAEVTFDRCVDDLLQLAARLRITYQELNILIFVVGFLAVLALQLALLLAIRRAQHMTKASGSSCV